MTTRASLGGEQRTAAILRQVGALTPGDSLTLSLIEVFMAFGDGTVGLSNLKEIAADHNCHVDESDVLGVTITKF